MQRESYQLSRFHIGSLREMWSVSFPLMLSFLGGSVMMLCDRLFLARYSLDALNACANAGIAAWIFLVVPIITASISEVFVGQFHGAEQHKRMGEPVWQMLWFALFLFPLFLLIASFAAPLIFMGTGNEVYEIQYFSNLLCFGSFFCTFPALSGFFIAKGSVRLVTYCTALNCIANVFLDALLIFGWGPIPELGITGAAIATGCSNMIGSIILFSLFMSKRSRERYGTDNWRLQPKALWEYLRVGLPAGLGHFNEMLAHFTFFRLVIWAGGYGMTIVSLVQSVYISVFFVLEALAKGTTAIVSNLIGGGQSHMVNKVLLSGIKLLALFCAAFACLLLFSPEALFSTVMSAEDQPLLQNAEFMRLLINTCYALVLFFFLDGVCWVFNGMLTAAGDTKFLLVVGTLCNWILYVVPVYFVLYVFEGSIDQAWFTVASCSFSMACLYFWRYRSGKWRSIDLVTERATQASTA